MGGGSPHMSCLSGHHLVIGKGWQERGQPFRERIRQEKKKLRTWGVACGFQKFEFNVFTLGQVDRYLCKYCVEAHSLSAGPRS